MPMNTAEMNHFQDIYDAIDNGQTEEAKRLICQEQKKTEHSAALYSNNKTQQQTKKKIHEAV